MNILKIRNDANSPWTDIVALVGPAGQTGQTGPQGPVGPAGYTPIKGTDYWTDTDKQEIINAVIASFTDGNEVSY